jgi:hypothetical protein
MLADPFGHGVCLIEFIGKGYDEIATSSDAEKKPGGVAAKNAKRS